MKKKETRANSVCLRSKRSEVRILSGIPVSKDLGALETAASSDKTSLTGSKTEAKKKAKSHRLDVANRILKTIGSHGRLFFSNHSDGACHGEPKRYAEFFFAYNGRLKYRDRWRGTEVDITRPGKWRGFADGGTLRRVVEHLRDFIIRGKEGVVFVREYWGYQDSEQEACNAALLRIYEDEGMVAPSPKGPEEVTSAAE